MKKYGIPTDCDVSERADQVLLLLLLLLLPLLLPILTPITIPATHSKKQNLKHVTESNSLPLTLQRVLRIE